MPFTAYGVMYKAAAALLPRALNSRNAWAQMYTIGLQESHLDERRQLGGPARSFWQFELGGGVTGVLSHPATQPLIRNVLNRLDYDYKPITSYVAMEHNDVLAFAFARLLLFTEPAQLPAQGQYEESWRQYVANWRPGLPHRSTWNAYYDEAWAKVPERLDLIEA